MNKTILLYGVAMALLIGLLKFVEYRFFVREFTIEFYIGIVALVFTVLGAWIGRQLRRTETIILNPGFRLDESKLQQIGISKREYEVLELMAQGLSNREIAGRLFVSTHTVKSHSSSLFSKLNVRRRTEAIRKAKELMLLP